MASKVTIGRKEDLDCIGYFQGPSLEWGAVVVLKLSEDKVLKNMLIYHSPVLL